MIFDSSRLRNHDVTSNMEVSLSRGLNVDLLPNYFLKKATLLSTYVISNFYCTVLYRPYLPGYRAYNICTIYNIAISQNAFRRLRPITNGNLLTVDLIPRGSGNLISETRSDLLNKKNALLYLRSFKLHIDRPIWLKLHSPNSPGKGPKFSGELETSDAVLQPCACVYLK